MRKKVLFFITFLLLFTSCKKEEEKKTKTKEFVISISIENANNTKAILHKFSSSGDNLIDSILITNNTAIFKGVNDFPERYLLTIEHLFGGKILIIENDSIHVSIKNQDLINANIVDSKINSELTQFQKETEKIYNQIDVLFPEMQRARISNDAVKLLDISNKIREIENEGIEFNFNYANENPNSFISAMILNDLSKRDSIDLGRIESIFKTLNPNVKKSVDSKEISLFLDLNHK